MAFSLIRLSCPHILCSARDIVVNVQFMCAYSTPEHINNLLFSCLKWPHDRNYHLSYRTAIRPTRISYILVCKCVPVCVLWTRYVCTVCLLVRTRSYSSLLHIGQASFLSAYYYYDIWMSFETFHAMTALPFETRLTLLLAFCASDNNTLDDFTGV